MGLHLYTGDSRELPEDDDGDGMKAYAFELLRELSDAADAGVFAEGSEEALSLKIPKDELMRIHGQILENVPANCMNSFGKAINAYEDGARAEKMRMNGHARPIEKHVLDISIHLATTLKTLLRAAATGDDPLQNDDGFEARDAALLDLADEEEEYDPELHEGWSDNGGGGEIVAGGDDDDENEESAPWKLAADHWKPEDERGDDDDDEGDPDWSEKPLFSQTPDPLDIDPETEALILAEASEMIVDMRMEIDAFKRILEYKASRPKAEFVDDNSDAYADTMIRIMERISERNDGKINLECLAIELQCDDIVVMMDKLNDLQKIGCVSGIFHNVADTALMLVDAFSNMIDADAEAEDNDDAIEANGRLMLTYIELLKGRLDLA